MQGRTRLCLSSQQCAIWNPSAVIDGFSSWCLRHFNVQSKSSFDAFPEHFFLVCVHFYKYLEFAGAVIAKRRLSHKISVVFN
jgi:hypothetical protein